MALVDDRELQQLAASPAEPLFEVLERARWMRPLVLSLAVLPVVYAAGYRTLSDANARFGLTVLDILDERDNPGVSSTAGSENAAQHTAMPYPLGYWCAAAVSTLGANGPLALVIVSLVSASLLVIVTFYFTLDLFGPRVSWWCMLLLACSGPLLAAAHSAAPVSMMLLFSMLAVWGYCSHLKSKRGYLSWPLVGGGVAMGLAILAAGPVAVAPIVGLLLITWATANDSQRTSNKRRKKPFRFLIPCLAFHGIAVAAGGWWLAWGVVRNGGLFLSAWLAGNGAAEPNHASASVEMLLWQAVQTLGPLLGLIAIAIVQVCRDLDDAEVPTRFRAVLPGMWFFVAFLCWMNLVAGGSAATPVLEAWRGSVVLPGIMLAAYGIEQVAQRRVGVLQTCAVAAITLVLVACLPSQRGFPHFSETAEAFQDRLPRVLSVSLGSGLGVLSVGGFALWWVCRKFLQEDRQQRIALTAVTVALVAAHIGIGLSGVRRSTDDDAALATFRRELKKASPGDSVMLITEQPPPPQLVLTVRAAMRSQSIQILDSWDAALSQGLASQASQSHRIIVVEWNRHEIQPTKLRIAGVKPVEQIGTPRFFLGQPLRSYVVVIERSAAATAVAQGPG